MCTEPGRLPNGQEIGCRKCQQCKDHYRLDWEGRCIAEMRTARRADFLTLTYGREYDGETRNPVKQGYGKVDHLHAAVLTYKDVQDFFKRLRKAGHAFRFFVAGEYGSLKGRAHWHVLMYWLSIPPKPSAWGTRIDWEPWGHGFVQFDPMTRKDIRYAVKYVQKGNENDMQSYFSSSKAPALGDYYFRWLARQYVEQWLAPQDLFYTFPESLTKKGERVRYRMGSVSAVNFIRYYLEEWALAHPGKHAPWSQLVEDYQDRATRLERVHRFDLVEGLAQLAQRPPHLKSKRPKKYPVGMIDAQIYWSERHNAWVAENGHAVLYWSFDEEGEPAWTEKIVSGAESERRRELSETRKVASSDNQNEYRRKSAIEDEPPQTPFKRRRG